MTRPANNWAQTQTTRSKDLWAAMAARDYTSWSFIAYRIAKYGLCPKARANARAILGRKGWKWHPQVRDLSRNFVYRGWIEEAEGAPCPDHFVPIS